MCSDSAWPPSFSLRTPRPSRAPSLLARAPHSLSPIPPGKRRVCLDIDTRYRAVHCSHAASLKVFQIVLAFTHPPHGTAWQLHRAWHPGTVAKVRGANWHLRFFPTPIPDSLNV